jgi:hypothetical protein
MTAQSCVFTIQENPWKALSDYESDCFASNNFRDLDIEKMEKWYVPKNKKLNLLYDLERMGVNQRALFPDLDGVAKGIMQSEMIRCGIPTT